MTQETELDLAEKALDLKIKKCIMGSVSYNMFEAHALLNAMRDARETREELLEALEELISRTELVAEDILEKDVDFEVGGKAILRARKIAAKARGQS